MSQCVQQIMSCITLSVQDLSVLPVTGKEEKMENGHTVKYNINSLPSPVQGGHSVLGRIRLCISLCAAHIATSQWCYLALPPKPNKIILRLFLGFIFDLLRVSSFSSLSSFPYPPKKSRECSWF